MLQGFVGRYKGFSDVIWIAGRWICWTIYGFEGRYKVCWKLQWFAGCYKELLDIISLYKLKPHSLIGLGEFARCFHLFRAIRDTAF
jgi:hypothetical protein